MKSWPVFSVELSSFSWHNDDKRMHRALGSSTSMRFCALLFSWHRNSPGMGFTWTGKAVCSSARFSLPICQPTRSNRRPT